MAGVVASVDHAIDHRRRAELDRGFLLEFPLETAVGDVDRVQIEVRRADVGDAVRGGDAVGHLAAIVEKVHFGEPFEALIP